MLNDILATRFGTYSVDQAINAGLDLEMPGINTWRTLDLVNRSIAARKVTTRVIKQRAKRVLTMVKKCANGAPEVRKEPSFEVTASPNNCVLGPRWRRH